MTKCPHCGSAKVTMVLAKGGYEYLCNLGGPHRFTCTVNKKRRPVIRTAVGELMSLGLSEEEAEKIIKAHPRASDDELVMEALKEKEKKALKAMSEAPPERDPAHGTHGTEEAN